jgi:hypothetical protein
METTIRLNNSVKERLDFFKVHPRESYNDVIARITENSKVKVDEESLNETIEILGNPEIMRDIAEALEDMNKGNYGVSLDEIEKELGLKNV